MNKAIIAGAGALVIAGGVWLSLNQSETKTAEKLTTHSSLSKSELIQVVAGQKSAYESNGFELIKQEGRFSLVVKDDKKVRKFLVEKVKNMLPPSYDSLTDQLSELVLAGDKSVLEGMAFDMDVVEDGGAKLKVSLKKLPDIMDEALAKEPEAEKRVYDFLAKGGFSYELTLDKKGEITGFKLTDIEETIKAQNSNETVKIAIKGFEAAFKGSMRKAYDSKSKLDTISVTFMADHDRHEYGKDFDFVMSGISGSVHQTTPYDQLTQSAIKHIGFDMKSKNKTLSIAFDNLGLKTSSEDDNGFINGTFDMRIPLIKIEAVKHRGNLKMNYKDFHIAIAAKHISKKAMEKLQGIGFGKDPNQEIQQMLDAYSEIVHSGLSFDINAFDLKKLDLSLPNGPTINLRDFSFALHAKLKENSLDLNTQDKTAFIPFIEAHARIALNSEDLDRLVQMNPMLAMVSGLKKSEGDLAVFNIDFENGNLTLNGNPLPF